MKNPFKKGNRGKTKEQLVHERKQMEEFQKNRVIAREQIFPILVKYATDAKHAENTINIFKSVITTMMQMPYKDMPLSGLKMDEQLTKEEKAPDRDFHIALIEALKDVTIGDAIRLLDGMAGSINGYTTGVAGKMVMNEIKIDDIIK